jgi:hypothetical protein
MYLVPSRSKCGQRDPARTPYQPGRRHGGLPKKTRIVPNSINRFSGLSAQECEPHRHEMWVIAHEVVHAFDLSP